MPEIVEVVKAVYDTNVMVSAVLAPGPPWLTLQLVLSGRVKIFVSPPLLEEYRRVLRRPRYQRIPNLPLRTLQLIELNSTLVFPSTTLDVTSDPDDNRIVECAIEGKVSYIVTGNKRHFPFSSYQRIKIVNAREFMEEVAPDFLLFWELLTP
jgi:putative PIN family toxin of toxin-antitoxin system